MQKQSEHRSDGHGDIIGQPIIAQPFTSARRGHNVNDYCISAYRDPVSYTHLSDLHLCLYQIRILLSVSFFITKSVLCLHTASGIDVYKRQTLLCAPSAISVYAENGVNDITVQAVMQTKTVKGTVLDENGEPLIGVSIVVKGTSTGTITDFDGKFSINLPAGSKELVVSYIGYKEQAIIVSGNAPLNIKMVPDTQALDEVVVIGYGTVKKRDLTGAVASVKSEDITMNPGVNPMDALQGKIAGLDITNSSGQAGSSPTVPVSYTHLDVYKRQSASSW